MANARNFHTNAQFYLDENKIVITKDQLHYGGQDKTTYHKFTANESPTSNKDFLEGGKPILKVIYLE